MDEAVADLARGLHAELEKLAEDFVGESNPADSVEKWIAAVALLSDFDREVFGQHRSVQRLLLGMSNFLDAIRRGRPTFADQFQKADGQQQSQRDTMTMTHCSAAVELLLRSGMKVPEACRYVANFMSRHDLPLPSSRHTAASRSAGPKQLWQQLRDWRKNLTAGRHGDELRAEYFKYLAQFKDVAPGDLPDHVGLLLRSLRVAEK
jgi:hypothetical protein